MTLVFPSSSAAICPSLPAHLCPVSPPRLNRLTPNGEVLGNSQTITAEEAFGAYTSGAAYSVFAERQRGAIKAGLDADFVVFDNDPLRMPPDEWPDAVHVQATLVAGAIMYGGL